MKEQYIFSSYVNSLTNGVRINWACRSKSTVSAETWTLWYCTHFMQMRLQLHGNCAGMLGTPVHIPVFGYVPP